MLRWISCFDHVEFDIRTIPSTMHNINLHLCRIWSPSSFDSIVNFSCSVDACERVLAMALSYSFDSAMQFTHDETQGKAQDYVLFVSTIASLLEHCASTPFRRFVANTLSPTPCCSRIHVYVFYTHEHPCPSASSSFSLFRCHHHYVCTDS